MADPADGRSGWALLAASRGVQASLLVVVLAAFLSYAVVGEGGADRVVAELGWPGAAALVVVQAVIAVSPFPSQLVAVPLAATYGFELGAVLVWSGWMVAAVLQYALCRRTAEDIDLDAWIARAPQWMRRFPPGNPIFLILARQLPIGPHLVNMTAGAMGVPLTRHLWCAAIGIVPEAVLVSGVAAGITALT